MGQIENQSKVVHSVFSPVNARDGHGALADLPVFFSRNIYPSLVCSGISDIKKEAEK